MGNEILPAIFSITPYNVIIVFIFLSTNFAEEKGLICAVLPFANISDIAFDDAQPLFKNKPSKYVQPLLVLEILQVSMLETFDMRKN